MPQGAGGYDPRERRPRTLETIAPHPPPKGPNRAPAVRQTHTLSPSPYIITPLIITPHNSSPIVHDFQRDLLFLLHDVARLMRIDADKRARAQGMTRAQWGILIWLERQPGISQKELSELLEVEPITVARQIDRLEGRGMVERRPDPRDRRIWRLHLLPPAHIALEEINLQRADMAQFITVGVGQPTLDTMTEALLRMKATLTQDAHQTRRQTEAHVREML